MITLRRQNKIVILSSSKEYQKFIEENPVWADSHYVEHDGQHLVLDLDDEIK